MTDRFSIGSGYPNVKGLVMYYEIQGDRKPLVLIHSGGSTIESSFGRIIPSLSKNEAGDRRGIAGTWPHGRS